MQVAAKVHLVTLVIVAGYLFRSLDAICGCINCCHRLLTAPILSSSSSSIRFPPARWPQPFYRLPPPHPLFSPPRHHQPLVDRTNVRLPVPATIFNRLGSSMFYSSSSRGDNREWVSHLKLSKSPYTRGYLWNWCAGNKKWRHMKSNVSWVPYKWVHVDDVPRWIATMLLHQPSHT